MAKKNQTVTKAAAAKATRIMTAFSEEKVNLYLPIYNDAGKMAQGKVRMLSFNFQQGLRAEGVCEGFKVRFDVPVDEAQMDRWIEIIDGGRS